MSRSARASELDHVFLCVELGAPEMDRLRGLGLVEGDPNEHPGQGTACRRVFFRNAYLELIWVTDPDEAGGGVAAPLRLLDRWSGRDGAASPFGVCARPGTRDRPPFPSFPYRPPYLPPGYAIHVATNAPRIDEPLLFHLPGAGPPDGYPPGRAQPLDHPLGVESVTRVRITTAGTRPRSAAAHAAARAGLLELRHDDAPLLRLTFDHGRAGRSADLRPHLPLVLDW